MQNLYKKEYHPAGCGCNECRFGSLLPEDKNLFERQSKGVSRMQDFRCTKCGKLLGRINGEAEIKCPRCKTVNHDNSNRPSPITKENIDLAIIEHCQRLQGKKLFEE